MAVRLSGGEEFIFSGVVSTLNSSSTLLGVGESFVGEAEDCSQYATVSVFVFSDVECIGNNLDLQFSTDGINWDYSSPVHTSAGIPATPHLQVVIAKFCRVVYTNGDNAQGTFRIQMILHRTRDRELTILLNEVLRDSENATLTRPGSDYDIDIARGSVGHMGVVHKFGRNEDLGTAIEDVWTVGGTYIWETIASTLEAISTSANDDAGLTGARSITVEGLDENFEEVSEVIVMNGTTVTLETTTTFIRVNRLYVEDAGSYHTGTVTGGSAGDITLQRSGAGNIQGEILRTDAGAVVWGFGQSQVGRYTVPAGKTGLLQRLYVDNAAAKNADVAFFQRRGADVIVAPFTAARMFKNWPDLAGRSEHIYKVPLLVPEKTDVWARARLLSGSAGEVTVNMEIVLHDGVI